MTDYFARDAVQIDFIKGPRGLPFKGAEPDVAVSTPDGWDHYYPYDDPDKTGGRHFAKVEGAAGVLEIWVAQHGPAAKAPQLVRRYAPHAWRTVEGASKSTDQPSPPINPDGPVIVSLPPLGGSTQLPTRPAGPRGVPREFPSGEPQDATRVD